MSSDNDNGRVSDPAIPLGPQDLLPTDSSPVLPRLRRWQHGETVPDAMFRTTQPQKVPDMCRTSQEVGVLHLTGCT